MDDGDLEIQKRLIEEEIRKRKRANAKARKEEEDRALTVTGPRKAKEKAKKDAGESQCHNPKSCRWDIY